MGKRQVDCAGFASLVDHYFDDGLAERPALDDHAASCPSCRAMFARMTADLADLPCQTFVELVTEYLEHALSADDRARMTRHLELCEGCRSYLQQMRTTIEMAASTPVEPPDPTLRATLVAAFRAIHRGS